MKLRMTLATVVLGLGTLAACGTEDEPETTTAPTPSATSETPAPTQEPAAGAPQTAEDLVGVWSDPEADWTVTFEADGTFTEDFQGVEGFRTGTYSLEDGTVTLEGGDGNADPGTVEGDTLVFKLGTLTRT